MDRTKTIGIVVIIAIIIIGVYVLMSLPPPITEDRQPVSMEIDEVQNKLNEGQRIDLATPDRTRWNSGDTGLFTLGIRNKYETAKDFYVNIFLDELGMDLEGTPVENYASNADNWFVFEKEFTIESEENQLIPITMSIPLDTDNGLYKFRIVICEQADCIDMSSKQIYDSTLVSIYVK